MTHLHSLIISPEQTMTHLHSQIISPEQTMTHLHSLIISPEQTMTHLHSLIISPEQTMKQLKSYHSFLISDQSTSTCILLSYCSQSTFHHFHQYIGQVSPIYLCPLFIVCSGNYKCVLVFWCVTVILQTETASFTNLQAVTLAYSMILVTSDDTELTTQPRTHGGCLGKKILFSS